MMLQREQPSVTRPAATLSPAARQAPGRVAARTHSSEVTTGDSQHAPAYASGEIRAPIDDLTSILARAVQQRAAVRGLPPGVDQEGTRTLTSTEARPQPGRAVLMRKASSTLPEEAGHSIALGPGVYTITGTPHEIWSYFYGYTGRSISLRSAQGGKDVRIKVEAHRASRVLGGLWALLSARARSGKARVSVTDLASKSHLA